jgi:hypothetical protein
MKGDKDSTKIIVLVIFVMVFIVSAVFAFFSIQEKGRIEREDIPKAKKEVDDVLALEKGVQDRIVVYADSMGLSPGDRDVRTVWPVAERLNAWNEMFEKQYGERLATLVPAWAPFKGRRWELEQFQNEEGEPAGLPLKLAVECFDAIAKDLQEKQVQLKTELDQKCKDIDETIKALDADIKSNDTDIDAKKKENENLLDQLAGDAKKAEEDVRNCEDEIARLNEQVDKLVAEHKEALRQRGTQKAKLAGQIDEITARRQGETEVGEADGKVIVSSPSLGYVWIDIGRRDALFRGTEFSVFAIEKGGKKRPRGRIRVIAVDEKMSKGAIISVLNPEFQISSGDFVTSESFDRTKVKTFAFAGKLTRRYSREELRQKIEAFGHRVSDAVSKETMFLVAGNEYEKDRNYEDAKQYGIIVITEKDLYDQFGFE